MHFVDPPLLYRTVVSIIFIIFTHIKYIILNLYKSVFLFFLMTSTLFGQTSSIIDSLKVELNKNQVDTIKAQVLNDLAYYYLYQDIDTSLIYGKQAELFATKINYAKIKAKANLYIGNAFLFTNQYDSAKYYYEKSYQIFDSEGLDKSAVYSSLGMFYKSTGDYQKAIEFYYNGLKYDDETFQEIVTSPTGGFTI